MALIVDKTVPAAETRAAAQAVQSAAGIDRERGDTPGRSSQVAFAKPPAEKKESPAASALSFAKYVAAGLATAALPLLRHAPSAQPRGPRR